ncbi:MAG: hypothetical protein COU31_01695 [Candidatus Magasanikbacteria bacterium CG10_big_fil_rev_8_21_14_0_10_40_10]|uniref:Thioredoxin-like fold domain-containing protein n=1 Tax=Candidatus Magasanikbacteria bacterium CG10_big_fil_rev_8_21_14_0_10_40_10 TaxID=1974648 RepID=A0A2M6W4B5_9BACT|nr:MAG: hypothetical protein COU31_01695 [Candidatus Magasanikbacteria bacterium CG10_big_fil_rev_8_21_14_0_10_40_10]
MKHHKQLYLALTVLIVIIGFLLYQQVKQAGEIVVSGEKIPILSPYMVEIPIDQTDPIYGNPGAKLTVVEFTDFNCAKCAQIHKLLMDFVDKNPLKIRLVWKGIPRDSIFGSGTKLAHKASYCADEQNKFWPYSQILMQDKKNTTEEGLKQVALGLSLDANKWTLCRNAITAIDPTASSTLFVNYYRLNNSLPAVFINNRLVNLEDEGIKLDEILKQFIAGEESV